MPGTIKFIGLKQVQDLSDNFIAHGVVKPVRQPSNSLGSGPPDHIVPVSESSQQVINGRLQDLKIQVLVHRPLFKQSFADLGLDLH